MRRNAAFAALSLVLGLAPLAEAQPAAPPSPPAPVTPPPPGAAPAPPAAPASPPTPPAPARPPQATASLANAAEARQGVARLERGGRALGLGAVLRSDGRIVTALSALGHGNFIEARFADGTVLPARVVHSDRAWDLALLAPEGGHWTAGLRPSVIEPPASGASLHRFRARGGRLEESVVTVSTRQALLGRDGATLDDVLVLSSRLNDDELGTPLLDERGEVAAIVVQACAPASPQSCQLATFGAPIDAVKQFLRSAPRREPLPSAWLGFRGVAAHDGAVAGVRVVAVEPNSPAAQAGLRGEATRSSTPDESTADLIVAVQDAPVATPEELKDAINRHALAPKKGGAGGDAGEPRVRLLVFGSGKFREVVLPVRPPRQLPEAEPAKPPAPRAPAKPPAPSTPAAGAPPSAPPGPGASASTPPAPSANAAAPSATTAAPNATTAAPTGPVTAPPAPADKPPTPAGVK